MNVTTERLENCQVKMIVELDAAEVDKRMRQTARSLARRFNVPGYRRGKAPYHAVIRVFGQEAVQQQVLDDAGDELYEQALEQIEYEPYGVGELQEVEWDPFRMTVLLPIVPEVALGDYRALRVPFEAGEVGDEQIDEYLAGIQQEHSQWVPVDQPAALGNQVVLDMAGKVGDEPVMDNEGYELTLEEGGELPIPGFHEQVVGLAPGQEKTFVLTMPEDDDDLAGREATITVKLHTVRQQDVPALDDDLAMMVGDYDTLDDLKVEVRTRLETEAQARAESEYLEKVLEAYVESVDKIEYPEQAVEREAELALNRMERNLASSGLQLDTYLGMIGKTRDGYKRELLPAAAERLKKRLVLAEIAKAEELSVEDDEVDAELERMAAAFGPQGEQMLEAFRSPEGRLIVADDLLTAKAQTLVMQIAKGEAPAEEPAGEPAGDEAAAEAGVEEAPPAGEVEELAIEPQADPAEAEEAEAGTEEQAGIESEGGEDA